MSALRLSDRARTGISFGVLGVCAVGMFGYVGYSLSQPRDKAAVLRCFFDSKQPGGQKIQVDKKLSVTEARAISPSPNCQTFVCENRGSEPLSNCAPADESGLQKAAKAEKEFKDVKLAGLFAGGLALLVVGWNALANLMRSRRIRIATSGTRDAGHDDSHHDA